MAANGKYITKKEACFVISRYLNHLPKEYRKEVYGCYLKDMQRCKLLKKLDRFKFKIINLEASSHIIIIPKLERNWF